MEADFDAAALPDAICAGDRSALARAITLVESTRSDHRGQAQELLLELMPHAGNAMHVGITGVPGIVLDGRMLISGVVPREHLDEAVRALRENPAEQG